MPIRQAVILAAGLNTRMMPVAKTIPKAMLPLGSRPVLHFLVEECMDAGIKKFVIVSSGKSSVSLIRDYLSQDSALEKMLRGQKREKLLAGVKKIRSSCSFSFVMQKEPLGEAHALLCARKKLKNEPFAVLYGDTVFSAHSSPLKKMVDGFRGKHLHAYGRFVFSEKIFPALAGLNYRALFDSRNNKGLSLPLLFDRFLPAAQWLRFPVGEPPFNTGDIASYSRAFAHFSPAENG